MNSSSRLLTWETLRNSVLTTREIRKIDQTAIANYSMNSLVLMENAALNCVNWILGRWPNRPQTTILCGSGNNGGDGLVIARHLRAYGWNCTCALLGPFEKLSPDAQANAKILLGPASGLKIFDSTNFSQAIPEIEAAELIIDAMLGTGATGEPRLPLASWIVAANKSSAAKLAIDIPTGIDSDTGAACSTFFATDATLTFVALKPAMVEQQSKTLFGEIAVLPIGIPEQLIREILSPK